MAVTYSVQNELGSEAPGFALLGYDASKKEEREFTLGEFAEKKALVVVFMCNHCPYVIAVQDRINQLALDYSSKGVQLVGISSNDVEKYPDDSFSKMKERADERGFVFPYLIDQTQLVAKSYGAVCTPDPYVYENRNGRFHLAYHGRIDDNWKEPEKVTQRDLASALDHVLAGTPIPPEQKPAMGCSIKWK